MQLPGKRGIIEERGWDKSSLTRSCHSISCCSVLTLSLEQHRRYLSVVKEEGEVMQEDSIERNGLIRRERAVSFVFILEVAMRWWGKKSRACWELEMERYSIAIIAGLFILLIASYSYAHSEGEGMKDFFVVQWLQCSMQVYNCFIAFLY